MALVKCPECKREVSSAAAACPQCAYPLNSAGMRGKVLTEQTGKKYKGQIVMSVLGLFLGVIIAIVGAATGLEPVTGLGIFTCMACLAWLVTVKFLAWWQHG